MSLISFASALVVIAISAGCGDEPDRVDPGEKPASRPDQEIAEGSTADYEATSGPAELATLADVVLSGTLTGVRAPSNLARPQARLTTDRVLAGSAGRAVEFPLLARNADADSYDKLFRSRQAIVYLTEDQSARGTAGRLELVNPEALMLGADGGVVQPFANFQFPGADLADFLPNVPSYPSAHESGTSFLK